MKNIKAVYIIISILVLAMGIPIATGIIRSKTTPDNSVAVAQPAEEVQPEEEQVTEETVGGAAEEAPAEEPPAEEPAPEEPAPSVLGKYSDFLDINPYVVGWLSLDGTGIDDPVVYTPGSQNYFLHRALDGAPLEKGTFFIAVDWEKGYYNTLIYGHNMKDGSGFGSLSKYADKDFGLAHPLLKFDTLYEEDEYELLAAFYSQIEEEELETEDDRADRDKMIADKSIARIEEQGGTISEEELTVKDLDLTRDFGGVDIYREEKDEDNGRFRYYYYTNLSDRNDYEYYIRNVKERALYDTGVDAEWGDELLTLSTCSYHVKNGRFIVVAVRHHD